MLDIISRTIKLYPRFFLCVFLLENCKRNGQNDHSDLPVFFCLFFLGGGLYDHYLIKDRFTEEQI
jgi:hypothetical protein